MLKATSTGNEANARHHLSAHHGYRQFWMFGAPTSELEEDHAIIYPECPWRPPEPVAPEMERGVPYEVAGWGWLSPPGRMTGIVVLHRVYVLDQDSESVTVLDAVTGWSGRLTPPLRVSRLAIDG